MLAAQATRAVTRITIPAAPSAPGEPASKSTKDPKTKSKTKDNIITLIMSVPERGLLVDPIKPHIYEEIPAAKKHKKYDKTKRSRVTAIVPPIPKGRPLCLTT